MVVSFRWDLLFSSRSLGKWSNYEHIFLNGWFNHQLVPCKLTSCWLKMSNLYILIYVYINILKKNIYIIVLYICITWTSRCYFCLKSGIQNPPVNSPSWMSQQPFGLFRSFSGDHSLIKPRWRYTTPHQVTVTTKIITFLDIFSR